jgi:hypothetical protein
MRKLGHYVKFKTKSGKIIKMWVRDSKEKGGEKMKQENNKHQLQADYETIIEIGKTMGKLSNIEQLNCNPDKIKFLNIMHTYAIIINTLIKSNQRR